MTDQAAFWTHPNTKRITIRDYPDSEKPTYRLYHHGPDALSVTELLACIIGTPTQLDDARHLVTTYKTLPALYAASFRELETQPGIGPAIAARIRAALGLAIRLHTPDPYLYQVRSPSDAANLLIAEMSLLDQEELRVIHLDTKNRVITVANVYRGSLNMTSIRIAELFAEAIRIKCNSIVVVHNHPSGDPTPSPEDVSVTKMIVDAGKLLDIDVLDHLVLGNNRFVSLKERGLGFV